MKDKSKLAIFKKGWVVIFPTDTVYGIGCRYDSQKAIDKIHRIKGTPKTQHFPILVGNSMQVEKIAQINNVATKLIKRSDEELDPKLVSLADYVIKGECIGGRESTVVDTTVYPPKILRQGAIQLTKLT